MGGECREGRRAEKDKLREGKPEEEGSRGEGRMRGVGEKVKRKGEGKMRGLEERER